MHIVTAAPQVLRTINVDNSEESASLAVGTMYATFDPQHFAFHTRISCFRGCRAPVVFFPYTYRKIL